MRGNFHQGSQADSLRSDLILGDLTLNPVSVQNRLFIHLAWGTAGQWGEHQLMPGMVEHDIHQS